MSLSYHLYASIYGKCNLHQITRTLYLNIFFLFFFFGTASTLPVIHIYTLKSVTLYYQFHLFYKKKFVSRNKIQKVSLKC